MRSISCISTAAISPASRSSNAKPRSPNLSTIGPGRYQEPCHPLHRRLRRSRSGHPAPRLRHGARGDRLEAAQRAVPLGRTDNFIKTKCHGEQEFVVAGYIPATAMPRAIGALIVAVHRDRRASVRGPRRHRLHPENGADLFKRCSPLRIDKRPVEYPRTRSARTSCGSSPGLRDRGRVRRHHPRRRAPPGVAGGAAQEDKTANEVVREMPAPRPAEAAPGVAASCAQGSVRVAGDCARSSNTANKKSARTPSGTSNKKRQRRRNRGSPHTSRPRLFAGRRRHQEGSRGVLRSVWDWIQPHSQSCAVAGARA